MKTTIEVTKDTWKKLSYLKIELGKRSLDEVVKHLLEVYEEWKRLKQ